MKNNKTVIITGGGTGIGKGIALKLAKNNFNIILASRNISNLQKVKEECNKLKDCMYSEGTKRQFCRTKKNKKDIWDFRLLSCCLLRGA